MSAVNLSMLLVRLIAVSVPIDRRISWRISELRSLCGDTSVTLERCECPLTYGGDDEEKCRNTRGMTDGKLIRSLRVEFKTTKTKRK
ncbi:hypothetical protein DPEC_G00277690 [Dallia pectoralis]|uniref:Uncharacterized protein n=1 Tax=Dallia pectoralis TaxID=75939 RepID=A0ACC2FM23_DALPE|nr:hypothetical protein DPEC_G00277690 [Dallia pectoralis]